MAKIVAQGQLTIVDMHDMPPIQGRLTSNLPKIVVLSSNGASQSPSWASTNLVVTAQLYKAGNPNDLVSTGSTEITGITWYSTLGTSAETSTLPSGITKGKDGTSVYDNKLTINKNLLSASNPTLKLRAVIQYKYTGTGQSVPVSVEIDFGLANNGVAGLDSYSAILTNTAHSFPCNVNGNSLGAYTVKTSAIIYKGTTKRTGVTLVGKSGQTLPSGMTIEPIDGETNAVNIKVSNGATLGGDTGVIYLTATVDSKSFDLAFSWSKSKQGAAGGNATSYWAIPSTAAIVKKWNGSAWALEPSSISVKAMSQTGTSAAAAYSTYFKIQLYNGSTALTGSGNLTTSTANEASRSLTPSASTTFTHAKITMYKAGGTSTILDEEEIRLVQEPKKAVVVAVSADNDTIRNNAGSATLRVSVYKDGTDISSSATKKWMKGTSTTSIGTGTTLVVNASSVASSEIFKCQVTVDGSNYTDTIVIYDVTDPIQMSILSSNGEVFKNGMGTTDLTCKLWRNGSVLDEEGTKYAYCWHKFKNDSTEDTAWTPTLKVAASSSKKSPQVAKLTAASNGATLTVDDVTYIRKGYVIFLGSVTTAYTVSSVTKTSGTAGTVVLTATPASTATNTAIYLASYKAITVTDSQVDEKATFFCELLE